MECIVMMWGFWRSGDRFEWVRGGEVILGGLITEVVQPGVYRVVVERGGGVRSRV
jgi:hypothetical protein